jgi:hypothetical protein
MGLNMNKTEGQLLIDFFVRVKFLVTMESTIATRFA